MKQAREAADAVYERQVDMTEEEQKQLEKLLDAYQERAAAADVPL